MVFSLDPVSPAPFTYVIGGAVLSKVGVSKEVPHIVGWYTAPIIPNGRPGKLTPRRSSTQ